MRHLPTYTSASTNCSAHVWSTVYILQTSSLKKCDTFRVGGSRSSARSRVGYVVGVTAPGFLPLEVSRLSSIKYIHQNITMAPLLTHLVSKTAKKNEIMASAFEKTYASTLREHATILVSLSLGTLGTLSSGSLPQ